MATNTMPSQRIARMLREGAKFTVKLPGHAAIDMTPDVIALLDEGSSNSRQLERIGNLLNARDLGRGVPTLVEFT